MIHRILVALDADSDTPVAIDYAADIARRYASEVTGLALVDMTSIAASSRGGGIGSMYLTRKVRSDLTTKTRGVAHELVGGFRKAIESLGVGGEGKIKEGSPAKHIRQDMHGHDMLIIGKDPHFFYSHPDETPFTLEELVRDSVCPTLVVPEAYREVKRVVVAYDGSHASARALRSFVGAQPFGQDIVIDVVTVYEDEKHEASDWATRMVESYMQAHGFATRMVSLRGSNPQKEILDYIKRSQSDLLVAGEHVVSSLTRLVAGSTTASLLHAVPIPLWLDS